MVPLNSSATEKQWIYSTVNKIVQVYRFWCVRTSTLIQRVEVNWCVWGVPVQVYRHSGMLQESLFTVIKVLSCLEDFCQWERFSSITFLGVCAISAMLLVSHCLLADGFNPFISLTGGQSMNHCVMREASSMVNVRWGLEAPKEKGTVSTRFRQQKNG